LGLLALASAAPARAADPDPAILATIDAAIAAINSGSVDAAKSAFAEAPAAIVDDFAQFVWSGKSAVEDYARDLKGIVTKYGITDGRFQRFQPRYVLATEDRAFVVAPAIFPFILGGKPQAVAADWTFVLAKQDGKWRIQVSAYGDTHHTLLP
jgi:hypothetical protein